MHCARSVEQNPCRLAVPVVKACCSARSRMPIASVRLDLPRPRQGDRIVGRQTGGAAKFPHSNELRVDADVLAQMRR